MRKMLVVVLFLLSSTVYGQRSPSDIFADGQKLFFDNIQTLSLHLDIQNVIELDNGKTMVLIRGDFGNDFEVHTVTIDSNGRISEVRTTFTALLLNPNEVRTNLLELGNGIISQISLGFHRIQIINHETYGTGIFAIQNESNRIRIYCFMNQQTRTYCFHFLRY